MPQEVSYGLRPQLSSLSANLLAFISCMYGLTTCCLFLLSSITYETTVNSITLDRQLQHWSLFTCSNTGWQFILIMHLAYTLSATFPASPRYGFIRTSYMETLNPLSIIPHLTQTALSCNSNWPSCWAVCVSSMHRESSSFMILLLLHHMGSLFKSKLAWTLSRGLRTKFSWKKKPSWKNLPLE